MVKLQLPPEGCRTVGVRRPRDGRTFYGQPSGTNVLGERVDGNYRRKTWRHQKLHDSYRRPVAGETLHSENLSSGRRSGLDSSAIRRHGLFALSSRLFGLTNAEAGAASPLNTVAHSFSFCSSHGLKIAPPPFSASPFT